MKWPLYYYYLLTGLGVSQLGNWIYLVALNVYIWDMTHSPTAVAGLYLIGPSVKIVCNLFVGSYVDRMNKKNIVVIVDLIRGILIFLIPFTNEIYLVFLLVILINIAGSFFGPSSIYLISTLISDSQKQKFNSINATLNSGSFMIGPAIAGGILLVASPSIAIWMNSLSFFICAMLLYKLPYVSLKESAISKLSLNVFKEDIIKSILYAKTMKKFSYFLLIYSVALMIAFSLDSQEMTFLIGHLNISKSLYGFTVTIAGIGAIIGGIGATLFAKKISLNIYMKFGFILTMISYLCFYSSSSYLFAIISLTCLGLFMSFSNSAFDTIFQQKVNKNIIGIFSSIFNLFQSVLQIILTLIIGVLSEVYSIQVVTVIFACLAVIFASTIYRFDFSRNIQAETDAINSGRVG